MHNSKCPHSDIDMEIPWGRFSWRILPPAALWQHRHKQDASHCWVSTCSIMPTQTQARCNSLLRKHKELNLEEKFSCWEKYCQIGTEDLIEMHDCYRQTWVQLFWRQKMKKPSVSALIYWKFEYKQSLNPNNLKGIQLYSSHSVVCTM